MNFILIDIEFGNLMDQGMSTIKASMYEEEYWKKYRLFGNN